MSVLVHKADCVEHTQASSARYGRTHRFVGGKRVAVGLHTAALMDATGTAPDGRMCLHHCDNEHCIHPPHLYWGTHEDNMRDREERKRIPPDKRRKLSAEQVCAIRAGAVDHTVTRTARLNIRKGVTYKEIQCQS